jgi:hypothetical protein
MEDAARALFAHAFHEAHSHPPPTIPFFEVDHTMIVPILFSDTQHPAALPGYVDDDPADHTTAIMEDGITRYYVQVPPTERWYVVIRGAGYHGIVHGAKLWSKIFEGHKNAKGFQTRTRSAAETAYRVSAARNDLRVLPAP